MKTLIMSVALLCGFVGAGIVLADKKIALDDVKCPVSGSKVNEDASVAYKDAKVFFCCEKCAKAFKEDQDKFATKANHQLVATKQFAATKCPYSGGPLNDATEIEVAGAKISFCCNNCKGKAEKLEGDEKLTSIFGKEAFEKGKFAKVEEKK